MLVCRKCGRENGDDAKFCQECAAPLVGLAEPREQRKTVTVLFCDVTGSTGLGESTDPEALRALLARYFERMKGIVESHGGTVEKFIGDAVMAVFGVPQVHEDDALRACRAAVEMRDALPDLGVQARLGVNTGEVVTGTGERLATGDAVNVAARLEQAAQPGEILIGADTLALVRAVVEAEPVEALELRGKAEPVAAFRLRGATGEPSRGHAVRMVGRETEFQRLRAAYEQAVRDRSCQLFTVLGTAGVGKSRLVYEFLARLDATVVRGRCLSYGQGITYWPVVEILRQLDALPADAAAAASLRSLLGESDEGTTAEEIAWSFRKLLEEQAAERSLVCVFDDIHWAEETLLDLIEHVADLTRGAPVFLLCMARPELLDARPGWGGGKLNATSVLLEPLSAAESEQLLAELGGVGEELRARILSAAEGNPLFVEEMLALVRASGDGEVEVPPTVQALLAARLDQLERSERDVLERGSVEGRVFHRGGVEALAPEESQVSERLVWLVRKELVRPDKALLPGEDAFRFRHLLIRDAAYEGLTKATRAELHERFADWLEGHGENLVELDEIIGHHLEQAVGYRRELGRPADNLTERAGAHLAAAGRLALWREDRRAASVLLERALSLTRPVHLDVLLEADLADTSLTGDPRKAVLTMDRVAERAAAEGDTTGNAFARAMAAYHRSNLGECSYDELEALCRPAVPLLEQAGDHAALVHIWNALGLNVANTKGRWADHALAAEEALRHSRLAGQKRTGLFYLNIALVHGPVPADEALERLDQLLTTTPNFHALLDRARLLAMLERFDEAVPLAQDANARLRELDGRRVGEERLAWIAAFQGDHERAAAHLGVLCDWLDEQGLVGLLSTFAPMRGRELATIGQFDDAEPLAQLGRELGDEQDMATQSLWRQVQALVESHRGEHAQAERLAREAVATIEKTDGLNFQADALCDLAEVLAAAGRTDEATDALEQALERYERKKNLAKATQVRPRLEELCASTR